MTIALPPLNVVERRGPSGSLRFFFATDKLQRKNTCQVLSAEQLLAAGLLWERSRTSP